MVNWATAIPLMSLLGVVFTAGVAWAKLGAQKEAHAALIKATKEAFEAFGKAFDDKLAEIKREHERSSAAQGTRLGELRADLKVLTEWRLELKGAERERLRTAAGGVAIQREE